ncbi:hypothetical protein ACFQL1_13290 [Halomicroarcula sp. GCM10025709]|uniref:DUF7519 family protein n=1 Tax=Haloarcula TaxID=2237 RepID=UPI0024C32084|nr:hypothetical protein [Halomicroarcula sp. YJ-61-S]
MSQSESTPGNYAPPRLSLGLGAVATLAVFVLVAPAPAPLGIATLGTLLGVLGIVRDQDVLCSLGGIGLFGSVLLAGTAEHSAVWLLGASIPVVLAWATARYACRLGRQVGHGVPTHRVELVHAVSTLAILVGGGGVGYLAYHGAVTSTSPLALGLLLLAAVAFTVALR